MAASSPSSCSASVSSPEYDVFLSFRGEDTRYNFTDHLYTSFVQNSIKAFRDDEELERGDEISRALKDAIERSKVSVIIFSRDYASSPWCLDELVHILECRKRNNRIVLPVFYNVDPSHVRKQKETFQASFANHEEHFKGKIGKLEIWRQALTEAANLAGWDSNVIRSESELIKKIMADVLKKLNSVHVEDDLKGFVGLERRFQKIEDLLCVASLEPLRTIGIWGPGGIGKTTLARIVFQRLYSKFDVCFFIEDIRVDWEQGQKKYYDSKNNLFDHRCLRGKRVLVVLDNVNDPEQLEFLAEEADRFGPGSRVIVTTRDMQILRGDVDDTYRVEKLDFEEALQLFCSAALRKIAHQEDDSTRQLCEKITNYAEGSPLALKVLSSFFRGKRLENWEAELNKLKVCPNEKIMNILRMSYDGLDEIQKCVFLDVAIFFKHEFRDYAERILEACGLHPKTCLDDLVDKSLIYINVYNKLCMHDLIQQMAWSVVHSNVELENRSRFWSTHDASRILETNRGTAKIEVIILDMSKISRIEFNSGAFQDMSELRLLKIFHSDVRKTCKVSINGGDRSGLHFFPDTLRYLHWEKFPWKSFPRSFKPQYLVELILPFSNIVQLWEGIQPLGNLKKVDVSHSKWLIELPDLSQASKLEHVYLEYCTSLLEVPSSIENLCELKTLNLKGCSSIRNFPKLPSSILSLGVSRTPIELLPQSIWYQEYIEIKNVSGCKNHQCSPSFSDSMSSSRIHKVFKYKPRDVRNKNFHEVSHCIKLRIHECSRDAFCPVLPLCYDFSGCTNLVANMSIPRTLLTKFLETGFLKKDLRLVFHNRLGFKGDVDVIHRSSGFDVKPPPFIVMTQARICHMFDNHQFGNEIKVRFDDQPDDKIMGFSVCSVVSFSDSEDRDNPLRRLYKYGYTEFNLFCRLYFYNDNQALFIFSVGHNEDGNIGAAVTECGVSVMYRGEQT